MKAIFNLKVLGAAVAACTLMSAGSALAAPFGYSQTAGFNCGATAVDAVNNGGSAANTINCTAAQLSWYAASAFAARSSLTIDSYSSSDPFGGTPFGGDSNQAASADSITPDSNYVIVNRLTHHNEVIRFTNGATSFQFDTVIDATFDLADLSPAGGIGFPFPDVVSYQIHFTETRNRTPASCPAPNPVGTGCDDIYNVEISGLDDLLFTGLDGNNYKLVSTLIPGTGVIVIPEGDGTLSVYTGEGDDTQIYVAVSIELIDRPVPEPTMLLLMSGMLLAGTGAYRMRQSAKK